MELRLNSPVGGSPAIYRWPLNKKKGYDEAKEIIDTITWGCKDIPDLEVPLKKNILKNIDVNSYESMRSLTKRYNKAINNILSLEKGTQKFCDRLNQIATRGLLHHIIQQTYSAAVTNAEELNKYQAFSPDVYGETSFDLIAQMLEQTNLTKDDVFVDLGSGVGQVVLQVAASSSCNICIGIERADVPAKYATAMEEKFKFWMQWYGKRCGRFELVKGDFFDDVHRDTFADATLIFVNNFAFGPSVDHKLKQKFAELKHGTRIVSSKSFCPLNFRITDRNLSDIGTIMNISEIAPSTSSVSWTDKPVSYYLHEIDRTKLENYFNLKKNGNSNNALFDDMEKSSDSFDGRETSDDSLEFTRPPPKKRRHRKTDLVENRIDSMPKPSLPELCDRTKPTKLKEPFKANNIIKPGKLILDNHRKVIADIPKKKRNGKQKNPNNNSNFISSNLLAPSDLLFSNNNSFKPFDSINGPFSNIGYLSMQNNLKDLMDNFKLQYLQMVGNMSDPMYKSKLRKMIEEESVKNVYLKMKVRDINEEIENIVVSMQNRFLQGRCK